ncbi:MAG: hypothetical protein COA90_00930 [Gammaproteobacteria bacterium]|nr:MAG: hypothetical protein COA90_00930 [Gammaproteobacteria bacterium]
MTIFLVLLAGLLLLLLSPIATSYFLIKCLVFKQDCRPWFFNVALTIDQAINVIAAELFNDVLLKTRQYALFGYPDETPSSVLGKNELKNNLSFLGRLLKTLLNKIDPNHTASSIEHDEGTQSK